MVRIVESKARQHCSECKEDKRNVTRWGGQDICPDCNEAIRREVEQSLYRDGIIEDPDMDGGLMG